MNMISTGAFLNEMDASNKQLTLAEHFAAVWEKKNAKAARAGGVSLMALSLAACGSSSTTTTTSSSTTTTTPTATAKTFTLTTAVDSGADFTGTSADDTYIADNTTGASANTNTLSAADELDGAGGTDTLKIYSDGNGDVAGVIKNIENINIYDLDDTFDLTNVDGISTVLVERGDGTQVIKVDNGETVNLVNFALSSTNAATDVSLDFGATATSATFGVNKIVAGATAARDDITLTGAKLETVNINATGTASVIQVLDVAGAKTVNIDAAVKLTTTNVATSATKATLDIDGAGAVVLGTLDAGFTTIDASGNSGGVTLAINNDDSIVTGSSGDDTITASATDALATTDKLDVEGGDGTDVLVLGDASDVNTAADGARYTGFETLSVVASQDVSLVSGITSVSVNGDSIALTNMNATNAASIVVTGGGGNTTAASLSAALKTATGTSDVVSITTKSATATTDIDLTEIDVDNFETMNFTASTGTNTTGDTAIDFEANKADEITALNILGSADVTLTVDANVMDVKAVVISAAGLTGTGDFTLADNSGTLVKGSKVIGSANGDTFGIQANQGVTYDGGAGDDAFTAAVATLLADGTDDTVVIGGAGTADQLTISDTSSTTTDVHFTNVSGMEKLVTKTGDTSITTGAAFNSAFSGGVTITSGTITDGKDFALNGGLMNVDATVTVDLASSAMNAGGEDNIVTTGSGADKITMTGDTTTVGSTNADGGSIIISSGAGDDTISYAYGTLTAQTTSQFATVTGGTGKDTITKSAGTNGTTAQAVTKFVIADGDSLTSGYDTITGFDMAVAASSLLSDVLDLAGGAVDTSVASEDYGTILSHNLSNGMLTFDDAAAYATALKITSTNLDDVIGYLKANVTASKTVGFLYDKDADGTNDSTFIFDQGTLDTLVLLDGVTAAGLTATATTTTQDYVAIA